MTTRFAAHCRGTLAALSVLFCSFVSPAALGPGAAVPQIAESFDAPVVGDEVERAVTVGGWHDWRFEMGGEEFLQIGVEPVDGDVTVTAIGPDGALLYERSEPSVVLSIELSTRMVVSFIGDRPGRFRLRVAGPPGAVAPARYRLRVEARRPAGDADRRRVAAHQLWAEGMRLFLQASTESRQAAVAKYEEALRVLVAIEDREGEALTLGTIANIRYVLSDAKSGTAASARALELWRMLGRDREEGMTLSDLGLLAYLAYDRAAARNYYDQALAKHRGAGDRAGEAGTLTRLGWIHYAAGELAQAIDVNQQALALWRHAGIRSGEAVSFNDLGRAYLDLGEVSHALDAFQQALAIHSSDRDARGARYALVRIGVLYLTVAEWQRALDALHQALTLSRRANDRRTEATVLSNLGSAHNHVGDTAEAIRYLEPGLKLSRELGFRGAEANVLFQLGISNHLSGEMARSRDYLQQALAIQTAIKDLRGQANTLRQLAAVQLALGSPQEALQSITESMEKGPSIGGNASFGPLTLANVYAALGDAPKAVTNYQRAINQAREVRGRDREATALAHFGRFQARQGRYAEARDLLQQGLAIHESLRSLIVDPDLRMSYTSKSFNPYRVALDVLMEMARESPGAGFAEEAFFTNERARARGFLDLLATSGVDIRQGVDPALVERERTLRWSLNAKAAIQTTLLSGKRDDARLQALEKEIADLSSALRETATRIRQESPAYVALVEPQPLTAAEVGRLLDTDSVLLEFALGERQSWLYAVTDRSFESFALPSRQTIEDAAREVYELLISRQPRLGETPAARQARIDRRDAELVDRSRAFSDLVLGPVGPKLADEWKGRRLVIVAAGALEYMPFGALPLPGRAQDAKHSAQPLVTAHQVVTLPSASILARLRHDSGRRPSPSKTVAVLADPVFAADDPRVSHPRRPLPAAEPSVATRSLTTDGEPTTHEATARALEPFTANGVRGGLARLPFTRAEARAVAALAPHASVLHATDFEASLALATSDRLADYRIVHFATHGLINSARPELSGLALSLVDEKGRARDGFLRLNTIYNMRLSADLVVLSACQSALGKEITGEGLVGLTRGFMYAGARGVIASLWQVDDVATSELMKRFYRGLLHERLTPAAALRAAQLEMRRQPQWSSPFFWAGFVLQGDWR
jgi:CHAT domain-containing protein/tetratricopeptide (TPR) repeat protein